MANYIPEEHYKGVQNSSDSCPLAFITPNGTDQPALNRIQTVKNWASGWGHKSKKSAFEVIKNEAMTGFKISEEVKRWSTSNVVWRIVDPRGFQLEISSGNMAYLMAETVIDHGVIDAELIWCRSGSQNYLLPVGSKEWKKYSAITASLDNKITVKDVTIGDIVMDGHGLAQKYLGAYHKIEHGNWAGHVVQSKKRHYFLVNGKDITSKSAFKNISIVEKGKPEDNKDWSEYLFKNDSQSPHVYYSKIKQNMKEVIKSLKFVKADGNKTHYIYDFVKYHGEYYLKTTFYGGQGQAQLLDVDLEHNTIKYNEAGQEPGLSYLFNRCYNRYEANFKKVSTMGEPIILIATVNGTEIIL